MIVKFQKPSLILVVFIILMLWINRSFAQEQEGQCLKGAPLSERLFFGGGLGLQFGTLTLIDVSPMVGCKLTNRIGIGISPTYKYYRYKNYYGNDLDLRTNILGGSIFARGYIYQGLFAQTEYEYLEYKYNDPYTSGKLIKDIWSLFVGGGYSQPIGGKASLYLMVLWNLHDTADSPYTNPVVRTGLSLGF
jgi:hypothetical protein